MATASGRALRVLVADDEHLIADTLATIFRNNGFDARSVYSGYSAIQTSFAFYPDIVISDIHMSGINGINVALTISRELPKAKFVLITGYPGSEEYLDIARARGLQLLCLQKPISPQLLINFLKNCALQLSADCDAVGLCDPRRISTVPETFSRVRL
jgi:CheY-like chemotaxis protein